MGSEAWDAQSQTGNWYSTFPSAYKCARGRAVNILTEKYCKLLCEKKKKKTQRVKGETNTKQRLTYPINHDSKALQNR